MRGYAILARIQKEANHPPRRAAREQPKARQFLSDGVVGLGRACRKISGQQFARCSLRSHPPSRWPDVPQALLRHFPILPCSGHNLHPIASSAHPIARRWTPSSGRGWSSNLNETATEMRRKLRAKGCGSCRRQADATSHRRPH